MSAPKILFMGTPDFAAESLRALMETGANLVGVLTQPDKPKGRGHMLSASPVKQLALAHDIPVFQPQTLKDGAFDEQLAALDPALIIVAAYGKILPPAIIHYPPLGCINVHGSLLPRWRGAAPIQRALMEGDTETGITIMRMDEGLDTGNMLLQVKTPITDHDNFETLHDRMAALGAQALLAALPGILSGTITEQVQDDTRANYARKIEKEDCLLDFSRSARQLFLQIRGLSPIPLAVTEINGGGIKIPSARIKEANGSFGQPGEVLSLAEGMIEVACGEGILQITEVLPVGKKRMKASDFINGRKVAVGDIFGGQNG